MTMPNCHTVTSTYIAVVLEPSEKSRIKRICSIQKYTLSPAFQQSFLPPRVLPCKNWILSLHWARVPKLSQVSQKGRWSSCVSADTCELLRSQPCLPSWSSEGWHLKQVQQHTVCTSLVCFSILDHLPFRFADFSVVSALFSYSFFFGLWHLTNSVAWGFWQSNIYHKHKFALGLAFWKRKP